MKARIRRTGLFGAVAAAAVVVATTSGAAALTLPTLSPTTTSSSSTSTATHSSSGNSQAGQPTPTQVLLCGMYMPATDRFAGNSSIDHPFGASATGNEYPYSGQNCQTNQASSAGMFSWTLSHSNVNVDTERGTEHGEFMLSGSSREAGFDGHITDFDLSQTVHGDPLTCGDGDRQVYYASGHAYDPCGQPSGPGNFNTHGGAQLGQHFRGNYGTIVYQETNNMSSSCQSGSQNYCFEAILEGQTN